MLRFVPMHGSRVDPVLDSRDQARAAKSDVKTPGHFYPIDVRRHAVMKFMTDVEVTPDDRLLSDEEHGIIDSALFLQADDKVA